MNHSVVNNYRNAFLLSNEPPFSVSVPARHRRHVILRQLPLTYGRTIPNPKTEVSKGRVRLPKEVPMVVSSGPKKIQSCAFCSNF